MEDRGDTEPTTVRAFPRTDRGTDQTIDDGITLSAMDQFMSGIERRILQITVAVGSLIPISAGAAGMLLGPRMVGSATAGDLDSHFRYLSGLLLAIGLGYLSTIQRIEIHGARFRLLTGIVVMGGLGRLLSLLAIGPPSPVMIAALGMELLVTPCLAMWHHQVARSIRERETAGRIELRALPRAGPSFTPG
jgi:hypothetical protein